MVFAHDVCFSASTAYILCLDVCPSLEFDRWFIFFKPLEVILSTGKGGFYEGTFVRSLVLGWLWIAKRSRWEREALEGRYGITWQIHRNSIRELLK